jgi:hypothetical protein
MTETDAIIDSEDWHGYIVIGTDVTSRPQDMISGPDDWDRCDVKTTRYDIGS